MAKGDKHEEASDPPRRSGNKAEVVLEALSGDNVRPSGSVAGRHNLSEDQLSKWKQQRR